MCKGEFADYVSEAFAAYRAIPVIIVHRFRSPLSFNVKSFHK
jgi:hypothetical protein